MPYLLDANILIAANSSYYPIQQVPEFWSWLQYEGTSGRVKIPLEIMEEVPAGRKTQRSFNRLDFTGRQRGRAYVGRGRRCHFGAAGSLHRLCGRSER